MIVKMAVSIASADWSLVPGDVVALRDDLAGAWLECGHAVKTKSTKITVVVAELEDLIIAEVVPEKEEEKQTSEEGNKVAEADTAAEKLETAETVEKAGE